MPRAEAIKKMIIEAVSLFFWYQKYIPQIGGFRYCDPA
jgi:hypothetical protein